MSGELQSAVAGDANDGWSNLRPVRALFAQLGIALPKEMGQAEFSELIEALELRGYEVATCDGARLTPLHDTVSLEAELRLRHDALAAPPASMRRATRDGGEAYGEDAICTPNDYQRASLRLELLTAGIRPEELDEKLDECVRVCTAGLAISLAHRQLLGRVAARLVRTPRDPLSVLTGTVRRLDPEDGEVLLRAYASLHPEHEDLSTLLTEHWSALCEDRDDQEDDFCEIRA
jgi:hypothetical protein